ncbi:doublecortin domain-containing protein 1-like [Spea bombifrons]|uniref:doublecortin domain-containing protein 1-like n=1 Tax=Spea bombifrons TaxID=233779 RepID=UPI00234B45A6|nr:doublecortin domain-containing protein 1-like [Spea bombifrons]
MSLYPLDCKLPMMYQFVSVRLRDGRCHHGNQWILRPEKPESSSEKKMAGPKRPSSASSVESQLSTFSWQSSCFSPTSCSRPSSLEDAIVKEYVDIFERPSTQMKTLPRKYKSPYANRSARHSKDRRYDKRPHLSPDTPLQSVRVSGRSAYQDCFPLQKASVQSRNVLSDVDLDKTDSADNSCLSSSSKRNTPASVPPGHVRYPIRSPHCSRTTYGTVPVFKRKVWVIRVTAYKNGTDTRPAKISAPTIQLLLERCTVKLELNMAARRVFLADGTEAFEPKDIPHDSDVYISTGEPFIDPLKNVKDNAFLRGKMAWTMKGLVLPNNDKRGRTQPVLSKRIKNLITEGCVRILVFANGSGKDGLEIGAMLEQMEQFLDLCTSKLSLGSSAKGIFDVNGQKIEDLRSIPLLDKRLQNSITPLRGPVWVTKGEGFSPTGVKTYIQGVLSALCQELKSSKSYAVQLEHFMNGLTNEVTQKEIFSMTEEELYTAHGEVNELIDELKTAIKEHKGQLSKLAPQLQAEREQHSTYMFRHIQEFPASALVPQGLHLKVYENGKDSGGTRIVISKKEMQTSSVHRSADVMQEFLQTIREKIQCSVDTGLRPSRLFDEKGQEIKNPLSLQNEQKIWFSYGEDFRPPAENILTLTFDKVIYTYVNGTRIISKAFVDPDVSLPGYESWHLCPSFPDNVPSTNLHTLHQPETVDVDSLFLQLKKDSQFVLYPSITIEVRSRTPAQKGKSAQVELGRASALLPCNLWLITKGGMILSRAMPRICLAVGHPIKLKTGNGAFIEGYRLTLQIRERNNSAQLWGFGNKGSIFSKAFPEFVLTYLKDLHVQEVPTQAVDHIPGQAWPPSQQDAGKISSKEAWQNDVSHFNQQQVSEASVAQLSPTGGPGEARQLTVALVKNLTGKHPQAPAQR